MTPPLGVAPGELRAVGYQHQSLPGGVQVEQQLADFLACSGVDRG
jgi:hypothetical protein